jgi:hypothetical protein
MYVLSIFFLPLGSTFLHGYPLLVHGSALYKYVVLPTGLTPRRELIGRPGCFNIFTCAHFGPPI